MHVIPHSQSTEPRAAPGGVALILQGSATLAAYQGGVAHALQEAGPAPYWAAGVSLGACYAALIAGNPPEHRIARISEFFSLATLPTSPYSRSLWSAWLQATLGATIGSRDGNPRLREILLQLVDFDRINRAETRLTLGATDPATGRFSRFDNSEGEITPEHVVASAASPPLPAGSARLVHILADAPPDLSIFRIGLDVTQDGGARTGSEAPAAMQDSLFALVYRDAAAPRLLSPLTREAALA